MPNTRSLEMASGGGGRMGKPWIKTFNEKSQHLYKNR